MLCNVGQLGSGGAGRGTGERQGAQVRKLKGQHCIRRMEKEQYDQYGFFVRPRLPRWETICSLSMDHLLVWLVGWATRGWRD